MVCPECGGHNLTTKQYANGNDGFRCWNCGFKGRVKEGVLLPKGKHVVLPSEEQGQGFKSNNNSYYKIQNNNKPKQSMKNEFQVQKRIEEYRPIDPGKIKDIIMLSSETVVKAEKNKDSDRKTYDLMEAALRHLAAQHISFDTACEMGIGVANHWIYGKNSEGGTQKCIVYVKRWNGRIVGAKYRGLEDKGFACAPGEDTPILPYNVDCLRRQSVDAPPIDMLVITEGEKDAMTVRDLGYPYVVSVPTGSGSDPNKTFAALTDFVAPRNVAMVVGCFDNDEAGRKLRESCCNYFGSRLYEAQIPSDYEGMPVKDISDLRLAAGDEAARNAIDHAVRVDPKGFIGIGGLVEDTLLSINGLDDKGYSIGLGEKTDEIFHLNHTGGLIVGTGMAGDGKSTFAQNVITSMIFNNNFSVTYLPFEEAKSFSMLKRMLQINQGAVLPRGTRMEDIQPLVDYVEPRFHLMDCMAIDTDIQTILRTAEAYPDVQMVVLDPFFYIDTTLMAGVTETVQIKNALITIRQWALDHHCWVMVLAHPSKPTKSDGKNYDKLDLYSVAGSAHFANVADLFFTVTRSQDEQKSGSAFYKTDITEVTMRKVRDQEMCVQGSVFYTMSQCGRFVEHESKEAAILHCVQNMGKVPMVEPWYRPSGGNR